jgi:hypothetical protein
MSEAARVLSFYLPQFYSIPVNDAWHGEGFTEWTKVKATLPEFPGHDQPRKPHESLGHYILDNADVLMQQAELMQRGGIFGQVFYHYWFGGTQILEKPAQILLDHPEIPMNFSFCWANESWTKRWDGGAGEVILEQTYSLEDAESFIRYLIPFFKDPRYVKVGNRPILMVYKTSQIPALGIVVEIWNAICESEGCPAPYLIAIQTGDTSEASVAGFSAEAERPVYHMRELAHLPRFQAVGLADVEGMVIDYSDVAELYIHATRAGILPVIPGVVVSWDQSPRHGTNALILVNRSPESYEDWLREAIIDSQKIFAPSERFVLVNAWNEWAEGAYLEPDSEFGFAFLDASKRAQGAGSLPGGAIEGGREVQ